MSEALSRRLVVMPVALQERPRDSLAELVPQRRLPLARGARLSGTCKCSRARGDASECRFALRLAAHSEPSAPHLDAHDDRKDGPAKHQDLIMGLEHGLGGVALGRALEAQAGMGAPTAHGARTAWG